MAQPLDRRSALVGGGAAIAAVGFLGAVFGLGFWMGGRAEGGPDSGGAVVHSVDEPSTESNGGSEVRAAADQPVAVLLGATVEAGIVVVEIEYRNWPGPVSIAEGHHAHVYTADVAVETVGAPGDSSVGGGFWQVVDGETTRLSDHLSIDAIEAGAICVATATPNHTLAHLETNCIDLEA